MSEPGKVQRISLQPAYLIHSRPFRDTSLIIEVLTPQFGRISLMARGVRSATSNRRALLQPFRSLLISWQGRGDLPTLTAVEEAGKALLLDGIHLACGYYLSELVQRLVPGGEMQAEVFALYDRAIRELASAADPEQVLRLAEVQLLSALGLLPDLHSDAGSGELIEAAARYRLDAQVGALRDDAGPGTVSGRTLQALAAGVWEDRQTLTESKAVMRRLIGYYIGDKPLKSRELFRAYAVKPKDES
ncbi:DNA repair protein RecO [Granulosicoccaceae sp. 1_MG-2023]|nr:DNA repair protein RecO [Granulosicoccaceae sp. 1_MG-2023]